MTIDPMDEEMPERKNDEIERSLELLTSCLKMVNAILGKKMQADSLRREEHSLREAQYPCDEYDTMSYDEDFKFDWL